MVGILLSYWGGLFSGSMLVSGRVSPFGGRSMEKVIMAYRFIMIYICIYTSPEIIWSLYIDVKCSWSEMVHVAISSQMNKILLLGGGFKHISIFTPTWGFNLTTILFNWFGKTTNSFWSKELRVSKLELCRSTRLSCWCCWKVPLFLRIDSKIDQRFAG